ncbi:MAG: hypothetical protein H0U86_07240 [Chloroflexi bacterium]|nr:hypothetical protein [Chloroflexota bacterium]
MTNTDSTRVTAPADATPSIHVRALITWIGIFPLVTIVPQPAEIAVRGGRSTMIRRRGDPAEAMRQQKGLSRARRA